MYRSIARERSTAGFSLLEVLVTLAVLAISLSSIGGLIAVTIRGTHSIERHLAEFETARTITATLTDRDQLVAGNSSGEIGPHRWRIEVSPFSVIGIAPQGSGWSPQKITVTVQSDSGKGFEINTVRLYRSPGR